jgi:serine/threonine protein kinase
MSPLASAHQPLPRGYRLDIYEFEKVLGTPGTFGITYAARVRGSDDWVAIKELFPVDCVVRHGMQTVVAQSNEDEGMFLTAKEMFRREAKILSQIKHENVVRVIDYLEDNDTGYMVMAYEHGFDLQRHLESQRPGRLNENELLNLLMPLLDGLEAVHHLDYLHRDIKPSNIYLTLRHKPLLLDFGAARQIVVSRSRPVTQILTAPYAPFEQYGKVSPMGPCTDIHAMGVVLFQAMLADQRFPDALDRLARDPFVPLARQLRGQEYSAKFLKAVDWALQFQAKDRPQTVQEWRKAFVGGKSGRHVDTNNRENLRTKFLSHNFWKFFVHPLVVVLAFVLLAALIAYLLGLWLSRQS